MTAAMTMGGAGYLYVYMGAGEQAAAAGEDGYIPFMEDESGAHTYTVPVEALNGGNLLYAGRYSAPDYELLLDQKSG